MRSEHRQRRIAGARHSFRSRRGLVRHKERGTSKVAAASFDVFITSDKNLRYQQNLDSLAIAIILLPSNQVPVVEALLPKIDEALSKIAPHEFLEITEV